MSAALSFRTIFALVPLLAVTFLLLKTVGIIENSKKNLRDVLEASGFDQIVLTQTDETAGRARQSGTQQQRVVNVADEIEHLVDRVEEKLTLGRVGPVGFLLLIYTATTLLTSIERSLNRILGAPRSRSLVRRLPLYWSVMTLGPILAAAGTLVGGQATEALGRVTGVSRFFAGLTGWAAPFLGYLIVLWVVYKLVPNTKVPWRSALAGAAVATPVWLIAKWAFAVYVNRFVRTGNLYGVLGLVPLFLVWLNLSWLIVLFGAEVANLAGAWMRTVPPNRNRGAGLHAPDLVAALLAIGGPFEGGRGPVSLRQATDQLQLPHHAVCRLLDVLAEMGMICRVRRRTEPAFVLARPAAAIPLIEVIHPPPANAAPTRSACSPAIAAGLNHFYQQARTSLSSLTLADLLEAGRRGTRLESEGGPEKRFESI